MVCLLSIYFTLRTLSNRNWNGQRTYSSRRGYSRQWNVRLLCTKVGVSIWRPAQKIKIKVNRRSRRETEKSARDVKMICFVVWPFFHVTSICDINPRHKKKNTRRRSHICIFAICHFCCGLVSWSRLWNEFLLRWCGSSSGSNSSSQQKKPISSHTATVVWIFLFSFLLVPFFYSSSSFLALFRRFNICHTKVLFCPLQRVPEMKHFFVCRFHRFPTPTDSTFILCISLLLSCCFCCFCFVLCEQNQTGFRECDEIRLWNSISARKPHTNICTNIVHKPTIEIRNAMWENCMRKAKQSKAIH